MGSGKSSAAITYINEHPEKRFIYLTPYLDETVRIQKACPDARFKRPMNFISEYGSTKTAHTLELIRQGENITSTHQCLVRYTPEIFSAMKETGYTVIIDETVNVLSKLASVTEYRQEVTEKDVEILLDLGAIYEAAPGEYRCTDNEKCNDYIDNECMYSGLLRSIRARPLVKIGSGDTGWCFLFSKEIFENADEVFILTYLFKGSEMDQFLKINGLKYQFIGVSHPQEGIYRFSDTDNYIPGYLGNLDSKIHICEGKINRIGDDEFSLSENWFKQEKNHDDIQQLKKNLKNFYCNIHSDISSKERMTGVFSDSWKYVRCQGCGTAHNKVTFNQRAGNQWSSYRALAYPVNIFLNPNIRNFYARRGGYIDEGQYALSIMVQWIWRSAIRNGEDIYLYIPSRRMRTMLIDWIHSVREGVIRSVG